MLLGGLAFMGQRIYEQRKEEARVAEEQREIEEAYRWIHYSVDRLRHGEYWATLPDSFLAEVSVYRPLECLFGEPNEFGIFHRIYLILRMYYHQGGVYLPYEMLIDYFSEEFEPDGTLRLYNNGHHPEIEAFVIWMRNERRITPLERDQVSNYREALASIYGGYIDEHHENGFRVQNFGHLSPQMYDALARAEADSDYVLDLTSLQEAGY